MSIRITGGIFCGRLLDVPKKGVRPTQDKVRAAIFSSLQSVVPGAKVLDLFAGTGAFGLEALGRGAEFVCFVENDPKTLACLKKNAERLTGQDGQKWRIVRSDVGHFLAESPIPANQLPKSFRNPPWPLATPPQEGNSDQNPLLGGVRDLSLRSDCAKGEAGGGSVYDVIFADPPYDSAGEWTKKILFHLEKKPILNEKGFLIIESGAKAPLIETGFWRVSWERIYGETRICMYKVHRSRFGVQGYSNPTPER